MADSNPTGYTSRTGTAMALRLLSSTSYPRNKRANTRIETLHTVRLDRQVVPKRRQGISTSANIPEQRSSFPRPSQNLNTKSVREVVSN